MRRGGGWGAEACSICSSIRQRVCLCGWLPGGCVEALTPALAALSRLLVSVALTPVLPWF